MPPAETPSPDPFSLSFFRHNKAKERPAQAVGLESGKRIGDYRLVALIGQGGMGQVWEAEQVSLGMRRVAFKLVRPERVTGRHLELFAREARAGGRLHHPGIVTLYDHGHSEGFAWIAMELVSGAWTLRDFLDEAARLGELPEDYDAHVASFVARIADAMQVAHDAGVIHRDMKPQNVLIAPDDHPKITDFGLARIQDEPALSETGDFAGTYFYMSPEQALARHVGVDHRSDVFSLGIVLYEMLALRRPFQGDTSHQVVTQIVTKDPADLRTLRSKIPRDLALITGKALEKDRDRRYQSMRELAADLRRHLANQPILARAPTRLDRARKWIRRNPAQATSVAIATAAFVAISALLVQNVRANRALSAERTSLASVNAALLVKTGEAERSAAEALDNARVARASAEDVLRLSALQRLDDLVAEAARLWPAHSELIERYEGWLREARQLVGELPDHRAKLAELRARAQPPRIEAEVSPPPELHFADAEDKWWHSQLEKLVGGIRSFSDPETGLFSRGISPDDGWGVERRLEFARSLRDGFASGEYGRRWSDALPAIHAAFPRLDLAPQMGLVPLGPDPDSGLWEFAHLASGAPAVRGQDGRLALTEETGLVLVLLLGGTFDMGAQGNDPAGKNCDPQAQEMEGPVHRVTLSPFFLSKYEMTQAQWQRLVGTNPSYLQPPSSDSPTLLHPVEHVDWIRCMKACARLGLALPTEAQWEYGARGDTQTIWWTGDELESLEGAANLADQSLKRAGGDPPETGEWPALDDGFAGHSPVDRFHPNPFGLHDLHGNVWEWCQDGHGQYAGSAQDPLVDPALSHTRVLRGGGYEFGAGKARSAARYEGTPELAGRTTGLRPARPVDRGE